MVIPEDFRNDQHILKPIFEAMFRAVGQRCVVRVCNDPLIGTVNQALRWNVIEDVLASYRYATDLFILCVDRDNEQNRRAKLDGLERTASDILDDATVLLGIEAHQEVEAWILASSDYARTQNEWEKVRATRDVKEYDFWPFVAQSGFKVPPSRFALTQLSQSAAKKYERMKQRSPELAELQERIRVWIESR